MEEQPADVYAGHYHGFINATAQSPSFRKLQMATNAGERMSEGERSCC